MSYEQKQHAVASLRIAVYDARRKDLSVAEILKTVRGCVKKMPHGKELLKKFENDNPTGVAV